MLELDSPNLRPRFEMTFGIRDIIERNGYTLLKKIGEGATREVFLARLERGKLSKDVVVKVPKLDIQTDSATTRANMARRNMDDSELVAVSGKAHRCIVGVYDAIPLGERTITVEEHFGAQSLEDYVTVKGRPLDDEEFRKVFTDVLSGLYYLHSGRRLLHRDLKPSNILVSPSLEAKLTDLQNAGPIDGQESLFPTRGGAAYTDPEVLNAIMDGKLTSYSEKAETFALGATMFYALTGEPLFDRTLTLGDSLHRVTIAGEDYGLVLSDQGQITPRIDYDANKKHIRKQLKKVPRKYRRMLKRCLDVSESYGSHLPSVDAKIQRDLEFATSPRSVLMKSAAKSIRLWGGVFAATLGLTAGLAHLNRWEATHPIPRHPVYEILASEILLEEDLQHLEQTNPDMLKELQPYFQQIKSGYHERILEGDERVKTAAFIFKHNSGFHAVTEKPGLTILRAIQLVGPENLGPAKAGRLESTLVPQSFIRRQQEKYHRLPMEISDHVIDAHSETAQAISFVKSCMVSQTSLPEVYSCYFLDSQDRFDAQLESGSPFYFPKTIGPNDSLSLEAELGVVPVRMSGYSGYLPDAQRDLISMATALYLITDHEGRVYTELINHDGTINNAKLQCEIPPNCEGINISSRTVANTSFECVTYRRCVSAHIPLPGYDTP
jgi:serine/threonine protein kinase